MDLFPPIKGRITDFTVVVIGHLKWNPYFNETEDAPPRGDPSTCTSTLIRGYNLDGTPYVLLVDPTLRKSKEDYYFDINRRTGLRAEDITHCFTTHSHFDHVAGLNYFPNAIWCASTSVIEEVSVSQTVDKKKLTGVEGEFLPGISTVSLPGHRNHLYGIAFYFEGKRVIVAADAVMTKRHFTEETAMFEQNTHLAKETIRNLKTSADFIIPGHDNLFFCGR